MNDLYDKGLLTEGAMLEFMASHTAVVFQPEFDDPRYSGMNPYALGYGMMADIRRISEKPTDEDKHWFPEFAGKGDWRNVLKDAWANYRDESFIEQFLSPKMMRDLRLFALADSAEAPALTVAAIHDEMGYRKLRSTLARQYDIGISDPNIQVTGANLKGNRKLFLEHRMHRGVPLNASLKAQVLPHIERLWGYEVSLEEVPSE
jgi:spore cortex formation protein SpoVR/YcgB (stage V sporulation)